jgi:hypothetical protein
MNINNNNYDHKKYIDNCEQKKDIKILNEIKKDIKILNENKKDIKNLKKDIKINIIRIENLNYCFSDTEEE